MKICIRVDSSTLIGTGHLMRCLSLAESLQSKGCEMLFICRELPGNISDLVEKRGYKLHRLPYDGAQSAPESDTQKRPNFYADWLGVNWEIDAEDTKSLLHSEPITDWVIVDHYAIDEKWERKIRRYTKKLMVIDDLADRRHDCDLLIDQNLYQGMEMRYESLVPNHCMKLLGPAYALLRTEFIEARQKFRKRDGSVNRVLIFFGGSDPTNETTKTLEAFSLLNYPNIILDVVVGGTNKNTEHVKAICSIRPNTNFYCQVDNMAELMMKADLSIGAGGSTTWERCFLGLPAIIIITAHNQEATSAVVAEAGAVMNLGLCQQVDAKQLATAIEYLMRRPSELLAMTDSALGIMKSGMGVASVCRELLEH